MSTNSRPVWESVLQRPRVDGAHQETSTSRVFGETGSADGACRCRSPLLPGRFGREKVGLPLVRGTHQRAKKATAVWSSVHAALACWRSRERALSAGFTVLTRIPLMVGKSAHSRAYRPGEIGFAAKNNGGHIEQTGKNGGGGAVLVGEYVAAVEHTQRCQQVTPSTPRKPSRQGCLRTSCFPSCSRCAFSLRVGGQRKSTQVPDRAVNRGTDIGNNSN